MICTYLICAGEMSIMRKMVRARYALLPFWYTLFYQAELTGRCLYTSTYIARHLIYEQYRTGTYFNCLL